MAPRLRAPRLPLLQRLRHQEPQQEANLRLRLLPPSVARVQAQGQPFRQRQAGAQGTGSPTEAERAEVVELRRPRTPVQLSPAELALAPLGPPDPPRRHLWLRKTGQQQGLEAPAPLGLSSSAGAEAALQRCQETASEPQAQQEVVNEGDLGQLQRPDAGRPAAPRPRARARVAAPQVQVPHTKQSSQRQKLRRVLRRQRWQG